MKGLFKNVPTPAAPLSAQNAYPPVLQARKVDMSKLKEVNVVPAEIIRDDMEYLFDEVHIIDEYNPSKPNDYLDFMKRFGFCLVFGQFMIFAVIIAIRLLEKKLMIQDWKNTLSMI